jgi:hypothetical protein
VGAAKLIRDAEDHLLLSNLYLQPSGVVGSVQVNVGKNGNIQIRLSSRESEGGITKMGTALGELGDNFHLQTGHLGYYPLGGPEAALYREHDIANPKGLCPFMRTTYLSLGQLERSQLINRDVAEEITRDINQALGVSLGAGDIKTSPPSRIAATQKDSSPHSPGRH